MARLCPLFSGSGGNSYYIGSRSAGLLIDAGRSARQLDRMLQRCGIDPMAIQGILITHEHSDHIAGVRVFAKKYGIPVFASQGTLLAMQPSLEGVESWVLGGVPPAGGHGGDPFRDAPRQRPVLGVPHPDGGRQAVRLGHGPGGGDALRAGAPAGGGVCGAGVQPRPGDAAQRALPGLSQATDSGGDRPPVQRGLRRLFAGAGPCGGQAVSAGHLSGENNTPSLARQEAVSALSAAGYQEGTGFWLDVAPVENQEGKSIIF